MQPSSLTPEHFLYLKNPAPIKQSLPILPLPPAPRNRDLLSVYEFAHSGYLHKWNLLCLLSAATFGGVLFTPEKLAQCCHTKWRRCRCSATTSPSICHRSLSFFLAQRESSTLLPRQGMDCLPRFLSSSLVSMGDSLWEALPHTGGAGKKAHSCCTEQKKPRPSPPFC